MCCCIWRRALQMLRRRCSLRCLHTSPTQPELVSHTRAISKKILYSIACIRIATANLYISHHRSNKRVSLCLNEEGSHRLGRKLAARTPLLHCGCSCGASLSAHIATVSLLVSASIMHGCYQQAHSPQQARAHTCRWGCHGACRDTACRRLCAAPLCPSPPRHL